MENEELLPKPQVDLPKPEMEIPAHAGKSNLAIFKSKFFLGFLVFSFLIAFLIGGFYIGKNQAKTSPAIITPSPTPDPTADSKTYEGNGFSFNYPSSSIIKESENPKAFITSLKSKVITIKKDIHDTIDNSPAADNFTLEIYVADNPNNLTPEQIIENYKSGLAKNTEGRTAAPYLNGTKQMSDSLINKINSSIKDFELNELSGVYARFGSDYDYEVILMSKNNKIYMFLYHNGEGGPVINDAKKYVDQILSTFKFTDSKLSCTPRPSCFDSEPRCLMPVTDDMCPPSVSPTPVSVCDLEPCLATPTPTKATQIFCAQDARQCPDGSWVGRSGPNCEFICPSN